MDNRIQSGLHSQRRELKGKKVSFGMSAPKVLQKKSSQDSVSIVIEIFTHID